VMTDVFDAIVRARACVCVCVCACVCAFPAAFWLFELCAHTKQICVATYGNRHSRHITRLALTRATSQCSGACPAPTRRALTRSVFLMARSAMVCDVLAGRVQTKPKAVVTACRTAARKPTIAPIFTPSSRQCCHLRKRRGLKVRVLCAVCVCLCVCVGVCGCLRVCVLVCVVCVVCVVFCVL
jgi:hypothetical protein